MTQRFALLMVLALGACSKSAPVPVAAPATLTAPAGTYELDPHHSSVSFSLSHLGLSNYVARFTRTQATLKLDPAALENSSVVVTIDPSSVRTDFSGDYAAAHKGTPYRTFDEALAMDPKFLNAGRYPTIRFTSTRVEPTAPGAWKVTGDLEFLGQTHPVTLETTLVGSTADHPFTHHGVVGFSATTQFKRSQFGMTSYLQPAMLGDEIRLRFEGEFTQVVAPSNG